MDKAFYADKAEKLFREGCNCSQAVFAAFCDLTGFSKTDALKISAGFGGGFARKREVCGAVSGMTMTLGVLLGNSDVGNAAKKNAFYSLVGGCMTEFSALFGSCVCREILKLTAETYSPISTARSPEFYEMRPCVRCIRAAAEITAEVLYENNCG